MDLNNKLCRDKWTDISSSGNQLPKIPPDHQSFTNFNSQQHQNKWEDPSIIDYNTRIEQQFPEFNKQSEPQSSVSYNADSQPKINDARDPNKTQDWDPKTMLTNLSLLEDKIHQLQGLVHMIVGRRGPLVGPSNELVYQQQQLITADLTSIIVQLISTAGSLLPSVKHALSSLNPSVSSLGPLLFPSGAGLNSGVNEIPHNNNVKKIEEDYHNGIDVSSNCGAYIVEEHESKDEDDNEEGENLPPGSYEILQLEKEEILAPHTHFCTICGKGFKRDANLRMHMRGHGDEYKTPAALAKPHKESSSTEPLLVKRYSCPYVGCKRNRDHKKFQPLKTILCVKNHYKRTHCDKSYTCSRCHTKKFSVLADLKTHEKHCGRDKWLCSCGTTFSRKDKLFGHITLFQGHTPAIPTDPAIGSACGPSDCGESDEAPKKVARFNFNFGSNGCNEISGVQSEVDFKEGVVDDLAGYFSPLNFDTCSLTGFQDFPRAPFEDVESSLSFLLSGSCNYTCKSGGEPGSNNQE